MYGEPFLSVVIPSYNESRRLPETLLKISKYLHSSRNQYEMLVVDDGSEDKTAVLVKESQKQLPALRLISSGRNYGKGHAVKEGVLQANGMYILMTDADLSTPIEEFDRFLSSLQAGFKLVIGTRKHRDAQILAHQPLWRESMGKVFTRISNLILGLQVSDFTCGFKAFEREAARESFSRQRINGWAFDSEILFLANHLHFEIKEVLVRWTNSPETRVRIFRDTLITLFSLFQIRWNNIRGRYHLG